MHVADEVVLLVVEVVGVVLDGGLIVVELSVAVVDGGELDVL